MLFNAILIAVSFFLWYISVSTIFFLDVRGQIDEAQGLYIEGSVRLIRILCQQFAFCWILISFQKYGTNVDKKIEKKKLRQSIKNLRPGPGIQIDQIDESTKSAGSD